MEILVPMADLIDKEAELTRLSKEIDKLGKEIQRLDGKLSNANFVDRAPAEVVAKEREKLDAQRQALTKLEQQAEKIRSL